MSDQITRWLDESQRLANEATDGPWFTSPFEHDPVWYDVVTGGVDEHEDDLPPLIEADNRENAEFIAEARTRLPQAVAALRAVMELHQVNNAFPSEPVCNECHDDRVLPPLGWPCETVRAVETELGLGGDDNDDLE